MDKNFIEDRLISGNMLPDDADFLLYLTNTNIIDYESKSIIERYADRLVKIKGNTNTFVYSKDYLLDIKKNIFNEMNDGKRLSKDSINKIITQLNQFTSLNLHIFQDTNNLSYTDLDKKYRYIVISHLISLIKAVQEIKDDGKSHHYYTLIFDSFIVTILRTVRNILRLQSFYYRDTLSYLITFKFDLLLSTYVAFVNQFRKLANNLEDIYDYHAFINELRLLIINLANLTDIENNDDILKKNMGHNYPIYQYETLLDTYYTIATRLVDSRMRPSFDKTLREKLLSKHTKASDIMSQLQSTSNDVIVAKTYNTSDNTSREIIQNTNSDKIVDTFMGDVTNDDIQTIKQYLFPILYGKNSDGVDNLEALISSCLANTEYSDCRVSVSYVDPNEIAYYVTREDHIIYYSRIDKEDAMWKCDLYLRKSQGNFYVIFDLDSNTYIGQMNIKPSDDGEYTLEVGKPLSTYEYKIEI